MKVLTILMLIIALTASIALLVDVPKSAGPFLPSLQEIRSDPSSWINKDVLVIGRLYLYGHLGFIYQSVAPVDYILVDNDNTQMPISSNGITMPIPWSANNFPTVENGIFNGPYALVWISGIVKNTTAGDFFFFPALYILTLNVTILSNSTA